MKGLNMTTGRMTPTRLYQTSLILMMSLFVGGCEAIAGIFRAGFWVGAILVILVIGIIAWVMGRGKS
jgi:hypothetical protein